MSESGGDDTLPDEGTPSEPDSGEAGGERYLLGEEIARGGMGRILVARDRRLGRMVAVKQLLDEEGPGSHDGLARFEREALITARLQHPAIVPVYEAGRLPGGEPFYAMRLVSGDSLESQVLAEKGLDARLALVPRVMAVVEAIAYAHSQRIIHRDLKPQNVLVGPFGETVVVNWGLAKNLNEEGAPPAVAGVGGTLSHGSDSSGKTVAGSVIGTPAYMPPEQAHGDAVDERADVWSLGAILYFVLAGEPPYPSGRSEEVLARVLGGDPPPLAERAPGAPGDLIAIVEKAMARLPAARYPSAKELAEDLGRFLTGKLVGAHRYSTVERLARLVRRHRAAVAAGAVGLALLLLTVGGAVWRVVAARGRAEAQRTVAERHRQAADELVGYMLADLYDRLVRVGKLDLLEGVGREIEAYYSTLGPLVGDDPALLSQRARALSILGDVRRDEGNLERALAAFREAMSIRARLAGRDAGPARQAELSESQGDVGFTQLLLGDNEGARANLEEAVALSRAAAAARPDDLKLRTALSNNLTHLGKARATEGEMGPALEALRAALAIDEATARMHPGDREWQLGLAEALGDVGMALDGQGSHTEAAAILEEAIRVGRRVQEGEPDDAKLLELLSSTYSTLSDAQRFIGKLEQALAASREALAIDRRLAELEPKNATFQRNISGDYTREGSLQTVRGDLVAALASHRQSLAIDLQLAERDPQNTLWRSDLGVDHREIGVLLDRQGDHAAALVELRAALAIAEKLLEDHPEESRWLQELAAAEERLALAEQRAGDLNDALADHRHSLELSLRAAQADPSSYDRARDIAISHGHIALVLRGLGDIDGALAEARASRAAAEPLAARFPTSTQAQEDLSTADEYLGDMLLRKDDAAGALASYRESLSIRARLVADDPGSRDWQQSLALAHKKIGQVLLKSGDVAGAHAEMTACLDVRARLAAQQPDNVDWQERLAKSEFDLGVLELQSGSPAAAAAFFRKALAVYQGLSTRDADDVNWHIEMAGVHVALAQALRRVPGEAAEARRVTREAHALLRRLASDLRVSSARATEIAGWERELGP